MNSKRNLLFFVLELFSGFAFWILALNYILPYVVFSSIGTSFLISYTLVILFLLFGISIPGYFHCSLNGNINKFLFGILNAFIFLVSGIIVSILISFIFPDFYSYRLSPIFNLYLLPLIFCVIGFNIGLMTFVDRKIK